MTAPKHQNTQQAAQQLSRARREHEECLDRAFGALGISRLVTSPPEHVRESAALLLEASALLAKAAAHAAYIAGRETN